MELQCRMRVRFATTERRDALRPLLNAGERPLDVEVTGAARKLFELTAHCTCPDSIEVISAKSLELYWDVTNDLEALELTAAALSMTATQVMAAVVPDEDGSMLWLAEGGENFALHNPDDPFDADPLGISCELSWKAIDLALKDGRLARRSMGIPQELVRSKKKAKPAKSKKAAEGTGDTFEQRRKAMLKANRSLIRRGEREYDKLIEQYVLTGELPPDHDVYVSPTAIFGYARAFHAEDLADLREKHGEPSPHDVTPHVMLEALLTGEHEKYCSEFGMYDGREREMLRALLPTHFDHEAWSRQTAPESQHNADYVGPATMLDWFLRRALSFLTAASANPHDPVHDLVDYWRQTLPFLDDLSLCGYSYDRLTSLMRTVRYFREPRDFHSSSSPARQLRDRLQALFDAGTGNATLDQLWADSVTPREYARRVQDELRLPSRVLLSATPQPRAMRQIHDAYVSAGWCGSAFDPNRVELVTLSHVMTQQLAHVLGYLAKVDQPNDPARVGVPAYHCRIDLGTHLTAPVGSKAIGLELFHLVPPPGRAFDPALPQMLALPTGDHDDEACYDTHAALCERRVAAQLESDHGLSLARSDDPKAEKIKQPVFRSEGAERYWCLPPHYYLGDYLRESDSGEPAKRTWKPWPKQTPPGVDLAAFRARLK